MLANRFPHVLWWGPHFIQFYNDPYRPVLGEKHPGRALGVPAYECWPEIWHVIGPLIERPLRGGPATWDEDITLEINRHGFFEESHFTIAYSPVPDETAEDGIGGVLATVHEITDKVIAERRVAVLRVRRSWASDAKTAEDAFALVAETLLAHDKDIPFALLYLIDPNGSARLAGAAGPRVGSPMSPRFVDLAARTQSAGRCSRRNTAKGCKSSSGSTNIFPMCLPDRGRISRIRPSSSDSREQDHAQAGFLIAGRECAVEVGRALSRFLVFVRTQIATAIANARAYEEDAGA